MVLPQSIEARRYSPLNKPTPTRCLVGWMRLLALLLIGILLIGLVFSNLSSSPDNSTLEATMFDFTSPQFKPESMEGYCLVEEGAFAAEQAKGNKVITISMLPAKHKIVRPGQMTTQEFVSDRLHLRLNSAGCIEKARWG